MTNDSQSATIKGLENRDSPLSIVAFLMVLDPSSGNPVSELDDAIFATAEKGTFYLADTNNNRVLAIEADDLPKGSLYASVGSLSEFVQVDTKLDW